MFYSPKVFLSDVQVPRNMDASSIVKSVRSKFYGHHMEYEFFVVMDVYKEKEEITKELQRSQVPIYAVVVDLSLH